MYMPVTAPLGHGRHCLRVRPGCAHDGDTVTRQPGAACLRRVCQSRGPPTTPSLRHTVTMRPRRPVPLAVQSQYSTVLSRTPVPQAAVRPGGDGPQAVHTCAKSTGFVVLAEARADAVAALGELTKQVATTPAACTGPGGSPKFGAQPTQQAGRR